MTFSYKGTGFTIVNANNYFVKICKDSLVHRRSNLFVLRGHKILAIALSSMLIRKNGDADMITAQCWLNRQNSSFAQKFQALDWNWVKNSEALRRYFLTLFLLKKYQIQLVPDVLADSVLHEHLSRPNFEQDMLTLLGQKLIHEVGTTEIKSTFTRDLFEEEFGSVDYWEPSDCGIILRV